jgi:aminoglycoside phosphotransferase family enzyme/predicted kinase
MSAVPDLPPLIEQMLTADFYPHPVTEPIQLLQTHISFVLLTGDYAYKVKKPMNFGFLDFSTLAKREYFCHEEIRLNQRLAPELYLEVLPISLDNAGKHHLGDTSAISEYALKMQQFDQENLLINLFEKNQLTTDHVTEIGRQLAKFHQTALTNDHIATFGTMDSVQQVSHDNYDATAKYIGLAQEQTWFDQTRAYTDQFFATHRDLFSQRITQDKIKECHGDAHLKNICLYQDKIQIFDCIEFNEPFRNSDVLYDAAFLLMDLQFRGRDDLANVFLNTYLEYTGDYEGLALLPLYCSMRAYVRAKVTSFLLDDPAIGEPVKQSAAAEARAYYQLAWQYTQPRQSKLIMMSGVSGSGKSTQARAIAAADQAIHLRSDVIRKHIAGVDLTERNANIYTPELTAQTYSRLCELGIKLAQAGVTVILDAKYDRIALRQSVLEAATAANIPCEIIFCTAERTTLMDRLISRSAANQDVSDATVELLDQQLTSFEALTIDEQKLLRQ